MRRITLFLALTILTINSFANEREFWNNYSNRNFKKASEIGESLGESNLDYLFLSAICNQNLYDYGLYHQKSDYYHYMMKGNYSSLKELLEKNYKPDNYVLNNLLGMVKVFVPDIGLESSDSYFYKSLKLKSENSVAHNYLSMSLIQKGEIEKGIEFAKLAIKENPTYPEAYNNLTFGYYYKKETEKAIDILIDCMKNCPVNTNSTYINFIQLACKEVLLLLNNTMIGVPGYADDAVRTKLLTELKGKSNTLLDLANQFYQSNSYKEVDIILNEITPSPDVQGEYYFLRSMNAQTAADTVSFEKYIDKLFELKESEFLLNIGNNFFQNQDFNSALKIYRKAEQITDNEMTRMKLLSNIGTMHLNLGNYDNAIEAFLRVMKITETDDITLTNIGIAYALKEDKVKAKEYLLKAKNNCNAQEQMQAIEHWLNEIEK